MVYCPRPSLLGQYTLASALVIHVNTFEHAARTLCYSRDSKQSVSPQVDVRRLQTLGSIVAPIPQGLSRVLILDGVSPDGEALVCEGLKATPYKPYPGARADWNRAIEEGHRSTLNQLGNMC